MMNNIPHIICPISKSLVVKGTVYMTCSNQMQIKDFKRGKRNIAMFGMGRVKRLCSHMNRTPQVAMIRCPNPLLNLRLLM